MAIKQRPAAEAARANAGGRFHRLSPVKRNALLGLILLGAFLLRSRVLASAPPGLTHDEANHGREAIGILQGHVALFFPLNYGSEPLYSYTAAALMALMGRGLLALRLVNVYFGLLAIAATYTFGRLAFDRGVGLLAAALMAICFWPLAASRQALRAGMMPFLVVGAVIAFWVLLRRARAGPGPGLQRLWPAAGALSLCLAATLYNYLAARVLWLLFPLFLVYLALQRRQLFRRVWLPVTAALLLTALLAAPMFFYLQQHPEAQTRLQMFGVLQELRQGQLAPLLQSASKAMLAFVWPGAGDRFLAYNLPGRPTLTPLTAIFFVLGLAFCLWRWRRPAYAFLLLWFFVGIIPSLLTGATANTTRNAAAMPATFLLPAVGLAALAQSVRQRWKGNVRQGRWLLALFLGAWLGLTIYSVTGDYFRRWARAPEVRAAYMQTLRRQLGYLQARPSSAPPILSSELPGPAHNQSIGLVLQPDLRDVRWVDARSALILPREPGSLALIPSSTPLHTIFTPWLTPQETVRLRPDDLDPWFIVYTLRQLPPLPQQQEPASFGLDGPALILEGSRWLTADARAGEAAELLLVWRVQDARGVGPYHAAIDGSDVVLFTHLLDGSGQIVAQDDRLDAPSSSWQSGDLVLQVHRLALPARLPPGVYTAVAGLYDRATQQPIPVVGEQGRWDATRARVDLLNIKP